METCDTQKRRRFLLSSQARNRTKYPLVNTYMARFSSRQQSVTALQLVEASIPNSVYPMNGYARMLEFTTSGGDRYFMVFNTQYYDPPGTPVPTTSGNVWTIENAFNEAVVAGGASTGGDPEQSTIADMFNEYDDNLPGDTTISTYNKGKTAIIYNMPGTTAWGAGKFQDVEIKLTYNEDTIKFDTDLTGTPTFFSYNSVGVKGGPYLCNDMFGISGDVDTSDPDYDGHFPDGININPIDNLFLRLSSNNYDYFNNIECLTDDIDTSTGGVTSGDRCFAVVPMDVNFGQVVYFHPNGEHYAGYKLSFPTRSIDNLVVEWLQYRNGQLSPVDFNGVNNTILLDVYSSLDRARPKCY